MSFKDVLGQPQAVSFLESLLKSGRFSGSYLFAGPDGVGKSLTLQGLAEALLCEATPREGCGLCASCRQVKSRTHPDLIWVEAQAGSTHSIESIRELKRMLALKPWGGGFRIVALIEAERATEEAQNALLKLLEEPPEQTLFVLTSVEAERLLPTVRSRCRTLPFRALPEEVISRMARERWDASATEATLLARLSQGSPGRAERFRSEGLLEKKNRWIEEFCQKALSIDRSSEFFGDREFSRQMLEVLLSWARDLWVASLDGGKTLFLNQDRPVRTPLLSTQALENSLQELLLAGERLEQNANQKLTLFVLATRLKELGFDG